MSTTSSIKHEPTRRQYTAPTLTVYGSVRDLTGGTSGANGESGGMMVASDPAYKENIAQVGTHPAGFGLYLFDYKAEFRDAHGHGRKFGVMADEVAKIVPEAVAVNADGYRSVDYAMIGVTLH
jgi:hypothetical protein